MSAKRRKDQRRAACVTAPGDAGERPNAPRFKHERELFGFLRVKSVGGIASVRVCPDLRARGSREPSGCRHRCGRCPRSPRPPGAPGSSSQKRKRPFQMVTAEFPALALTASEAPRSEACQPLSQPLGPLKCRALISWAWVTWPLPVPGIRAPRG